MTPETEQVLTKLAEVVWEVSDCVACFGWADNCPGSDLKNKNEPICRVCSAWSRERLWAEKAAAMREVLSNYREGK